MSNGKVQGKLGIHFFYVTLILVMIIIVLVTHKWTGISDFREYLNVGATATSLVLGILAIIYSFVSNGNQSGVLGAVEAAAATASTSVDKIGEFIGAAEGIQAEATARSNDLKNLVGALESAVNAICQETSSLVSTNTDLAIKVNSLPIQLVELRGLIESSNKNHAAPPEQATIAEDAIWDEGAILESLRVVSLVGLGVVESFVQGFEFARNVSLEVLGPESGDEGYDYVWGFAMAFYATRLVSGNAVDNNSKLLDIVYVHPLLKGCLDTEWQERISVCKTPEDRSVVLRVRAAGTKCLIDK